MISVNITQKNEILQVKSITLFLLLFKQIEILKYPFKLSYRYLIKNIILVV